MLVAVSRAWPVAVLRLTALLAAVGLATSRLGLLAHELLGHGGVAIVLGGGVVDATLFWFAGGWVRTQLDPPDPASVHAVVLGGIAVELVIGIALWLVLTPSVSGPRRADGLGRRILRAVGATLVGHGALYLGAGTYHGFGDGALLHRELGDARLALACAAGAVACGAAFLGARLMLGALAATIPGSRLARIAGVAAAIAIAGGIQLGLAAGELHVRRDTTYGAIMQPEAERRAAREAAEWVRRQRELGIAVSDDDRAARQRELAEREREGELPLGMIFAICMAGSILAGAVRARPAVGRTPVSNRLIAIAGVTAIGSLVAVIALDAWFH